MQRKLFKTSDGVEMSYISAGEGKPIVMLHGWSQSAEQFKYQIPAFAEHYRVIAVDLRGHGESEKVSFGYRIARLSKDLQELIGALQLEKPHLLGHSMGCAIIWSYLDLFGADEIDRLVLVDQSPLGTLRSHWNAQEIAESGAIFTAEQLNERYQKNSLSGLSSAIFAVRARSLRRCCTTIFIQTGAIELSGFAIQL